MIMLPVTIRLGLNASQAPDFETAFLTFLAESGYETTGPVVDLSAKPFSAELSELGLSIQLNQRLTDHGLTSPPDFTELTETDILAIPGVGYAGLRELIRALLAVPMRIDGRPEIAGRDLIEHLGFNASLYGRLKEHNFHSISYLRDHLEEAARVIGWLVEDIVRLLRRNDRSS